jgi:hypothetical protein
VARPFDVRAPQGRTFGSVLDEIAPGWRGNVNFGFAEFGPITTQIHVIGPHSDEENRATAAAIEKEREFLRRLSPIIAALRDGTLVLVGIDGPVPRRVLFAGWVYQYDEEREIDWLEVRTEAGDKVRYYSPRFAGKAPRRSDKGGTDTKKKTKPAGIAAAMVAWLDRLPSQQRNKTPNALADLYVSDPSRRGSKRYASRVFANPDKYRGRSAV